MALDNGGAYAIRGFNFQKASIINVIIDNFLKENFTVVVEGEDDFVIEYINYKAFVQCKNQKLSVSNLIKSQTKKKKVFPSILQKNLETGTPNNHHKIFLRDFIEKEKKLLETKTPGDICERVYILSVDQKNTVIQTLKGDLNDVEARLDNFKIYFPPFPNELTDVIIYLTGKLNIKGIKIDNNKGREIIAELSLMIDQKSEIVIEDEGQLILKELSQEYFKKTLIQTIELITFDDILNRLTFPTAFMAKVKGEQLKIELMYKSLKRDIEIWLEGIDFELKPDREIIDEVLNRFKGKAENSVLVAITIEIISSKGSEMFGNTASSNL
ncbi:dsDNA nuclease domain-containing protein [Solibacillus sp. FSL H8-0538]|uniref:dsDNA nuclease domain-containing protein n=1 Tax=Solibacillus sp. FSL H8-0538 TaxID=2921400 RepID=UPI0030F9A2D6